MLQELIEKQICFAVIISQSSFKLEHLEFGGKSYFIVISESDEEKVESVFEPSETIPGVMEYDLSETEIEDFKSMQELFQKVSHDKNGRIYELKSDSFKDYFHNQTQEIQ